jgi:osmotically-inducible protein OsmY
MESAMTDDKHLKQSVLDELKWEPSVDSAHIGVSAKDGVVTLMGTVERYSEKSAAEAATLRVKGVKAVAEEIEVKLPFSVKHDDAEIAKTALDHLSWNVSVPKDGIKVTVSKGWVTLSGQVEWHYQRVAAADSVRTLWGVIGLSNEIMIKPTVNASDIKSNIMLALDRSWFSSENVDVSANGGKVTLTGHVDHWDERDMAGVTAWAAPGVTAVTNDIRVN